MRIDEREIDRLSKEVNQKEYTGLFYGPNGAADFKTCMQDYLASKDEKIPVADLFPIRLVKFLEGEPDSKNKTICIMKVEYDLIGGLSIHATSAYKQRADMVDILDAGKQLKMFPDLPSRSEVLALDYTVLTIQDQIKNLDDHTTALRNELNAKGYDGPFFSSYEKFPDVKTLLNDHVASRSKDEKIEQAFPVWIGTSTSGSVMDKERTLCKLRVQYNPQEGFDIDRIKYSLQQKENGRLVAEKEVKLSSIKELPSKSEINKKVDHAMKSVKKTRIKLF